MKRQPRMQSNNENNSQMFKYSTTIEKERPQLDEETKRLISEYKKNPTNENYNALRKKVESNYDKVLERKKAKLEVIRLLELVAEPKTEVKLEMQTRAKIQ